MRSVRLQKPASLRASTKLSIGRLVAIVLALAAGLLPLRAAFAQACPPAMPFASLSDRVGVNVTLDYGKNVDNYDVATLRAGWYIDYARRMQPSTPGGMSYVQVLRTGEFDSPNWRDVIGPLIDANPAGVWAIGNEMDRNGQDGRLPSRYATIYHDAYEFIKGKDPTSTVMVGAIVQPTPVRLLYLEKVLEAYRQQYGTGMPVEYWNMHGFILREVGEWGAFLPPGTQLWHSFVPAGGFAPIGGLRVGDFDGDGKQDVFRVNGSQWSFYPAATGSPRNLLNDSTPLSALRFGDFDGDGKTDVFSVNGSQWRYSSAGAQGWTNLPGPGAPLSQLALGDFNGDGKTDVFTIGGTQWRYSSGGASAWINLATDPTPLSALRFGDFNGDGKTDAFSITGTQWRYLPGATVAQDGTVKWQLLNNDVDAIPLEELRFGDFNGDGRTDVFALKDGRWRYSSGGSSAWRDLIQEGREIPPDATPVAELRFGDFDGDGVTDILGAKDGRWRIAWAAQSEAPPKPWTISDHGDIEIFKQLIVDFRRWLAMRGFRDSPLVVSEYGILMPPTYSAGNGRKYDYEFVRDYMLGTFRYMADTKNSSLGYPRDENRLVQAWAWYSLNDIKYDPDTQKGFNGNLFDHNSGVAERLANDFRSFTTANYLQYTDVAVHELKITPSEIVSITGPLSIEFSLSAVNRGNLNAQGVRVEFWLGNPQSGGVRLGQSALIGSLGVRCGDVAHFSFVWTPGDLEEGFYPIYAVITYQNSNREFDAANNSAAGFVRVGPRDSYNDLFLPTAAK